MAVVGDIPSPALHAFSRVTCNGCCTALHEMVRHLRQRLAVVLVRDNMVMLMSRAPAHPPPEIDGDS